MRGFVVVFKGAYEIASLSPRKTRSLRAFFLASARQKPLITICLCSGCADILYPVCRGGFYRGVYNGIHWQGEFLISIVQIAEGKRSDRSSNISGFVFLPLIWLPEVIGIAAYFFGVDICHGAKVEN